MTRKILSAFAGGIALAGCSGSSTAMLRAGDPSVCMANDVTQQLFDIVRENARGPVDENSVLANYTSDKARWLKQVSIKIDNVTSDAVDRDNQSVSCTGKLLFTANNVEDTFTRDIEYSIKADLSNNKPIVSANVNSALEGLQGILSRIAQPEIQAAQDKHDAQEEAEAERQVAALYQQYPQQRHVIEEMAQRNIIPSLYTSAELSFINRSYFAEQQCMAGHNLFCKQEDRLNKLAKNMDLCDTAGNEWYHCSREDELEQQRRAHAVSSDSVAQ